MAEAEDIRRYAADRRSPSLSGLITIDTRVITANFPAEYAETIAGISLDLAPLRMRGNDVAECCQVS
jgi:hypothetical protein